MRPSLSELDILILWLQELSDYTVEVDYVRPRQNPLDAFNCFRVVSCSMEVWPLVFHQDQLVLVNPFASPLGRCYPE